MVAVSAASLADVQLLGSLHAACFAPAWDSGAFGALLASSAVFSLLAWNASDAAGFIVARSVADEAEILSVGVREDFRRQGIGTLLVKAASASAERRGATHLFLEVAVHNAAALSLYDRLGFRGVGRRPRYYVECNAAPDALVLASALPLADSALGKTVEFP